MTDIPVVGGTRPIKETIKRRFQGGVKGILPTKVSHETSNEEEIPCTCEEVGMGCRACAGLYTYNQPEYRL